METARRLENIAVERGTIVVIVIPSIGNVQQKANGTIYGNLDMPYLILRVWKNQPG
jgi:hypothetical protein